MYHMFEYKLQKSTHITFTRWLPCRKREANMWCIINKKVGSNVLFSYKVLKYIHQFLFIIQKDAFLMYHKFDYKLQK